MWKTSNLTVPVLSDISTMFSPKIKPFSISDFVSRFHFNFGPCNIEIRTKSKSPRDQKRNLEIRTKIIKYFNSGLNMVKIQKHMDLICNLLKSEYGSTYFLSSLLNIWIINILHMKFQIWQPRLSQSRSRRELTPDLVKADVASLDYNQ